MVDETAVIRAITAHAGVTTAGKVTDKYSISVDRLAAFVRIKLGGFFALEDVQEFAAAQRRAYETLASAKGRHVTLCDVSACKIQPQEVVEAFRGLLTDRSLMSARMAFVTGASPAKMQIRRLIARDTCRFFEDEVSAERWLVAIECQDDAGATSASG
ncbi:hypothetical protein [Sphingomonas sp. PB4P5]|uniref:hypothetical protein n=1 Tax=Parasphingomonas puruogangriensis TaxID=3096155 RepID=UPI002FC9BF76